MRGVVVLNADAAPLCVVSLKRAISYILDDKVDSVQIAEGEFFRAQSVTVEIPRVVQFKTGVEVPYRSNEMNWSRVKMLDRDLYTCGYCGEWGNTVDHIVPRSHGGKLTWMNTITACRKCNNFKADRTPEEAGMELLFQPKPVYRKDTLLLEMAATGADLSFLGVEAPKARLARV